MGHTRGQGAARKGPRVKMYIPLGSQMGPKISPNFSRDVQKLTQEGVWKASSKHGPKKCVKQGVLKRPNVAKV